MVQRLGSSLVKHGAGVLANQLVTTQETTGSIVSAVAAGGRVLLHGNLTQEREQQVQAGSTVEVDGVLTNATHYFTFVPVGHGAKIKGGTYVNTNQDNPSSVVRTANNSGLERIVVEGMLIKGDVQEDKGASYAVDLRGVVDGVVRDISASKYTGALHLSNCRNMYISNIHANNMVFIPSQNAGGYGVLLGGCDGISIEGLYFRAIASEGAKGRHAFYVSAGTEGIPNKNVVLKNIFATYEGITHRWMWTGVLRTCENVTIENLYTRGGPGGIGLAPENGTLSNVRILNSYIQVNQIDNETIAYGLGTTDYGSSPINSYVNFTVENVVFDMVMKEGITRKMLCAIRFNGRDSQFRNIRIKESKETGQAGTSPIVLGASYNLLFDGLMFSNRGNNPAITFEANAEKIKLRNFTDAGTVFNKDNLIQYGRDISVDWARKAQITISSGSVTLNDSEGLFSSVTVDGLNCTIKFHNHVTWDAIESLSFGMLTGTSATVVGRDQANKTIVVRFFNGTASAINLGTSQAGAYVILTK